MFRVNPQRSAADLIAVQINHPIVDLALVSTTEWKQTGVLGLLGYITFAAGHLFMLSTEVIGLVVIPSIAQSAPGYVSDVLAVANGGHAAGDIGLFTPFSLAAGVTFIGGGLLFGIALFRANILARWAAVVLAAGSVAIIAIPLLPQVNQRLFAIPTGVALVDLGYSLWREQRTPAVRPAPSSAGGTRDPVEAR
jgi:hypothetical protein